MFINALTRFWLKDTSKIEEVGNYNVLIRCLSLINILYVIILMFYNIILFKYNRTFVYIGLLVAFIIISNIYCRIHIVHIFLIQLIPQQLDRLAKALKMDDFSLPQEFDGIIYIRVIAETQNVVIGRSSLLFCCNHIRTTF